MLHRIQLPDCVPQLEQIRQFQRDVLALAVSDYISLPLTEDTLMETLGNDRGAWLWQKLWKQRGKHGETAFHLALIAVIEYVDQHPHTRQPILDAFDNDVTFHESLDDPNFHFQFNALEKEIRDILKPLMVSFYGDLLASGFETAIHGQPGKLDRDAFVASFWKVNSRLEVCPACDRQRSDKVDNKVYDDADHFLPKSKYPFLSLHYENLVPLCIYCNRSFKGTRDSIDDQQDAPLLNIFHPYERPALEYLNILTSRDDKGVPKIELEDKDGMPSRRVENLKRVFRLHERWPDQLRYQIQGLRDDIANMGRRIRTYSNGQELTEQELQSELEEILKQRKENQGERIGYVLQTSYLTFILNDNSEFQEIFREFAGNQ